jgi:hypothetical protein
VSATPEQIADWLIIVAVGDAANEYTNRAEHMRAAASLIRAQAERVRVLEAKLEKIAGEAPAKEPIDCPSVAWPPGWSDDLRDTVNDMILDAFRDGYTHACWRLGQMADAALKPAP